MATVIMIGLVAMLGLILTTAAAEAHTTAISAAQPLADTPTPTLGSTPAAEANPPGSADGDPNDWSGLKWLPLGLLIPVLFIAGVFLAKRRDRRRDDSTTNPPSPRVN
ncbi:hypothetical protein [Kribbella endophytica]